MITTCGACTCEHCALTGPASVAHAQKKPGSAQHKFQSLTSLRQSISAILSTVKITIKCVPSTLQAKPSNSTLLPLKFIFMCRSLLHHMLLPMYACVIFLQMQNMTVHLCMAWPPGCGQCAFLAIYLLPLTLRTKEVWCVA